MTGPVSFGGKCMYWLVASAIGVMSFWISNIDAVLCRYVYNFVFLQNNVVGIGWRGDNYKQWVNETEVWKWQNPKR